MLFEEYKKIEAGNNPELAIMKGAMLTNQDARTLTYGFTVDRETFHTYLTQEGKVVRVIYDQDNLLIDVKTEDEGLLMTECVPNKRLYPERCDFEFCQLLLTRQVYLPFTVYEMIAQAPWYGKKLEELTTSVKPSDFVVSRPVTIDELGLPYSQAMRAEMHALGDRLTTAMQGHITGYLRSSLLRADPNAGMWLENLGMILEQLCLRAFDVKRINKALAAKLRALVDEAKSLCDERAALLLASHPA